MTGKEYPAASDLTSDELLQIASIAKNFNRLNSYVKWCEAAIEAAKREKSEKSKVAKIRKLISLGKKDHDEVETNYLKLPEYWIYRLGH
jgi:hypothetical protein